MTGAWRARVVSVTGGVHVRIPALTADARWGPCQILERVTATGSGGSPAHTHPAATALAVGDLVLVVFPDGRRERPVVIDRITGG